MNIFITTSNLIKKPAIAAALLMLMPLPCTGSDTLVLTTIQGSPSSSSDGKGYLDITTTKIFNTLGYDLSIQRLPAARALIDVDTGIADATAVRIEGMEARYRHLLRVPESLSQRQFVAVVAADNYSDISAKNIDQLNVAFISGRMMAAHLSVHARSVTRVDNIKQLYKLLLSKKVDMIITTRTRVLRHIETQGLQQQVRIVKPALAVKPMYMYVNEKHAPLIAQLVEIIRDMKRHGDIPVPFDVATQ